MISVVRLATDMNGVPPNARKATYINYEKTGHVSSAACTVQGCSNSTRDQKPWCPDHIVDYDPNALRILADMGQRDKEVEKIKETGLVIDGILVAEATMYFKEQAHTVPGLARQMKLTHDVVGKLVNSMRRRKLLSVAKTSRGGNRYALVDC